jgi:hypothetical protein
MGTPTVHHGSVYSWRAWRIANVGEDTRWDGHRDPALHSVVQTMEWGPAGNHGHCIHNERATVLMKAFPIDEDDEEAKADIARASALGFGVPWPFARLHDDEDVPCRNCTCGLYGYTDWDAMCSDPQGPFAAVTRSWSPVQAVGIIRMWGRIQVHEHGYRAEYAQPAGIVLDINVAQAGPRLSTRYKVPVVSADFLDHTKVILAAMEMPHLPAQRTKPQPPTTQGANDGNW